MSTVCVTFSKFIHVPCIENCVDPDQLPSMKPADQNPHCFSSFNETQTFREECIIDNYFSSFSTKTYVVGTQKNRLDETVLYSTQNKLC